MHNIIALTQRPIIELPTFFTEHPDGLTINPGKDCMFEVKYPEMINYDTFKYHIGNLKTKEPGAFLVTHTNAEPSTLSAKEHVKIIKYAVETAGDTPVIAGTGGNSTKEVLELTLSARELGAKAVLIPLPYYNRPSIKGVKLHMRTIRKYAKDLPIIMCLHCERSNADIDGETVIQFFKEGTIQGLLIENCEQTMIDYILDHKPEGCPIFTTDKMMYSMMRLGSNGVVSSVSNFDFDRINTIFQLLKQHDYLSTKVMQNELQFICATMKHVVRPISLKTILSILDDHFKECFRSPLCTMSQINKNYQVSMLKHVGIMK